MRMEVAIPNQSQQSTFFFGYYASRPSVSLQDTLPVILRGAW